MERFPENHSSRKIDREKKLVILSTDMTAYFIFSV